MTVTTISPTALHELCQGGPPVDLIDVRTPAEFGEVHAAFARNVPLDRLAPTVRNGTRGEPLYFICRSGSRAKKACERFLVAGYTNVAVVEGGTTAWEAAGLPLIHGRKALSLERQVRIAAGLLVVLGVILGWAVDPACSAIAGFIGAGLVFSGITDTCGMAMLLARMPWNQVNGVLAAHPHGLER
jgi:rhodanese-related sulfurtransferase